MVPEVQGPLGQSTGENGSRRRGRREPEAIQHDYYARTASRYDDMHVEPGDEHYVAATFISALLRELDLKSLLDVGAGTGRGVAYFRSRHPDLLVRGVEPVAALVNEARRRHKLPTDQIVEADGRALPFEDGSFDAVCEFAVLHHVAKPDAVVGEMLRVARRAVFLSDENRFGHGRPLARLLKLGLCKARLWPVANYMKTRGRGYRISEGDGISYSYSVYDSLPKLAAWADRVVMIPVAGESSPHWSGPLLSTPSVLACALRD
jgi:ubiquinone/menaquinone biosynthesis C-methylase UbiE